MLHFDGAGAYQFVIDLLYKSKDFAGFIVATFPVGVAIWQWLAKRKVKNLLHRVEEASKQEKEESIWELSSASPQLWFIEHAGGLGLPIIVVGNLKGGVGKTVTSAYLAHCLSKYKKKRVLAIDLDYQGSLTDLLDKNEITKNASGISKLLAVGDQQIMFSNGVATPIPGYDDRLSLISASSLLAPLENRLQLEWLLERQKDDIRYRLAHHLSSNWVTRQFDVVVIDTPPRMTVSTFNALTACSHVVIPTSLKTASYSRVPPFIRLLTGIKSKFNSRLTVAGIAITLTNQRTSLTGPEQDIRSGFIDQLKNPNNVDQSMGPRILEHHIPRLNILADAVG